MIARMFVPPAALLLAGWTSLFPWRPHLPAWVERWLYNPRERTEQTIEALREGKEGRAAAAAETAHRLAPADPRTSYNAGTANLAAGRARKAAKLLEKSSKAAAPELAPAAWYNLGNARLAAADPAAAVEAYKEALLRNPADADAKHNLELALQEREKQRLRMGGQRQGSRGDRPGEREQSRKPGEGSPDPRDRRADPQDPGRGAQGNQQSRGQEGPRQQPSPQGGGRLPNFQNQPEMSAREAAALLSSVENLERRQRREQAAKRAREKAAKGKDW